MLKSIMYVALTVTAIMVGLQIGGQVRQSFVR